MVCRGCIGISTMAVVSARVPQQLQGTHIFILEFWQNFILALPNFRIFPLHSNPPFMRVAWSAPLVDFVRGKRYLFSSGFVAVHVHSPFANYSDKPRD